MKKSKDAAVQKFLDDLEEINTPKFKLIQKLRKLVQDNNPNINEKMMYGGIMFFIEKNFGGLFVSKNHVSFEFTSGALFADPENVLEGKGKYRRHIKFKLDQDLKNEQVKFFVKQAVRDA